jgi:hypothetical protein
VTGWTWDYCRDHMDLPRLLALADYHKEHAPLPTVARLIAQSLGVEFTSKVPEPTEGVATDADFAALLSQIPEKPK